MQSTMNKTNKKDLSQFCKDYLKQKNSFKWFIERYFGKDKFVELWNLAESGEEDELRSELNSIWYELPDNLFNILNNPPGWDEFLRLIEE